MRRAWTSMLLVGAFGSACSLFTPLSGFSGGDETASVDASSVADGGIPPVDGATGNDANTSPDSPVTPGDDASTTGFCKAQPASVALCMDFDDGTGGPPSGWTSNVKTPGGVDRTTSPVRSSPHALRSWVTSGNDVRHGYWARPIGTMVAHARLSYSLFVEERPTGAGEVEVNLVRFDAGPTQDYYYLALSATKAEYWEQHNTSTTETANPIAPTLPISVGKWARVSVELVLTGTRSIVVSVDGTEIVRQSLNSATAAGTALVTAGVTWADEPADNAKIVVDDVLFEILP